MSQTYTVITGASSGIGQAFAYKMASEGRNIIINGRNKKRLNETKKQAKELGAGQVLAYTADLVTGDEAEKFAQYCFDKGQIENFVHCLGFGDFSAISDQAYSQIAKLTHTNLLLTMFLSKRFAAGMLDQDTKANNITLIASVAGLIQTPKSAVYAASKAGVHAFANGLRQDLWSTKIKVTCILPGPVDTAFFDIADKDGSYFENVQSFATTPEIVADKMATAIERGQFELVVPFYYDIMNRLMRLAPSLAYRLIHMAYEKGQFRD
ncbi:SDR family oxidoreductase [Aerococcus viridans]|uniref:SDR family NAD(P)-dependent oxidoreductase n=1 Tax=Aerococcus viridans TaxID=1377 RepID=UPI0028FD14E1|nr:SDR family oxidoreductase [Aerococcus viridans]